MKMTKLYKALKIMSNDTDFVHELLIAGIGNSIQMLSVGFCVGGNPPTTFF